VSSNPTQVRCTRYNIMWLSLTVTCDRLMVYLGTLVSSINKTDRHPDITEILLKVASNTITLMYFMSLSSFKINYLGMIFLILKINKTYQTNIIHSKTIQKSKFIWQHLFFFFLHFDEILLTRLNTVCLYIWQKNI
jgi:hypothetical protein